MSMGMYTWQVGQEILKATIDNGDGTRTVRTGLSVEGDVNIGNVDIASLPALPAGTNNIGDVDVATLPALVAGTARIGKLVPEAGWTVSDTGTHEAATATKTAEADKKHYVTSMSGGFAQDPTAATTLTLKFGSTAKVTIPMVAKGNFALSFSPALEAATNEAVTVEAGDGGVAIDGYANITGFTV